MDGFACVPTAVGERLAVDTVDARLLSRLRGFARSGNSEFLQLDHKKGLWVSLQVTEAPSVARW